MTMRSPRIWLACVGLILPALVSAQSQDAVITFAGAGRTLPFGDGGPAVSAFLAVPQDVAVDSLGNVYISDTYNNRIRRVDLSGTITTVAGTGEFGFGGDGGPAVSARLSWPGSIAVDSLGNVYIADTYNHRIRRVDPSGTITTVAGTGESGFGRGGFGGDGGPAVSARLDSPDGVAVDSLGQAYIADTSNNRIRRVDLSGTITTVAGTGVADAGESSFGGDGGPAVAALLDGPNDVAVDSLGNVYISDTFNNRIRRVDLSGTITTVAGGGESGVGGDGGPAVAANIGLAEGVAVDSSGDVYIAARNDLWRVDSAGTISRVLGSYAFPRLRGVALDGRGYIYLADGWGDRILRLPVPSGGTPDPPGSQDPYTPLEDWTVSDDGEVHFLFLSTSGGYCIPFPLGISGRFYEVHTSKWQWRSGATSAWTDVQETATTGELCPPSTPTAGQYRGVAEISIDGERGQYSTSNVFIAAGTPPPPPPPPPAIPIVVPLGTSGGTVTIEPQTDGSFRLNGEPLVSGTIVTGSDGNQYRLTLAGGVWTSTPVADAQPSFGNLTVSNQTYTAGSGITPLTLPAASGGDGTLSYSLSPNVPGLTFNTSTRTLSGTPSEAGTYAMTYTARDADGDTVNLNFTVSVAAGTPVDGGPGSDSRFNVGDTIPDIPSSGFWSPNLIETGKGAGFVYSNGTATLSWTSSSGVIEYQTFRWTCASSAGCEVVNGRVTKGTVVQSGTGGTLPGSGGGSGGSGQNPIEWPLMAGLDSPRGLAVASAGQLYIADTDNHRILRVDLSGTITTVAGSGESGFGGDGGPAVSARLNYPHGVAVDSLGQVYIADSENHRIRRVDLSGTITTVAGSGESGFYAGSFGGDGGPAVSARLNNPRGVAVDSLGQVFFADIANHRIRRVDLSGTITTVAGSGESGFSGDGGPAVSARLNYPSGVAVDGAGQVYIADSENDRIRRVDLSGTITTVAGSGEEGYSGDGGPAVSAGMSYPGYVAVDSLGQVYIVESNGYRLRRVDSAGTISTVERIQSPAGLALDERRGYIYVAALTRIVRLPLPGDGPPVSDARPSFGTLTVSDQTYTAGTGISPLTLPAASGGEGTLSYSLSPNVPGLTFSTSTRTLSGTPSGAGTYTMTYTARDANGNRATLNFTVSVAAGTPVDGGPGSDSRFNLGDTIPDIPSSGFWSPNLIETGKGAGFVYSNGTATLSWTSSAGVIEYQTFRWTCASSAGCEVVNGRVTKGTVVQSEAGG